jgi:hypothetical protein
LFFFRRGPLYDDVLLDVLKVLLLVASAVLVVVRSRRSLARGVVVALTMLLANASVQGLKYWSGWSADFETGFEPLSGHAGLVGAVALTWVVTAPSRSRTRVAGVAAASIVVTALAAVTTGQHSPVQVVCPLVICLGWALALLVLQHDAASTSSARAGSDRVLMGIARRVAVGGLVLVLLSSAAPAAWDEALDPSGDVLHLLLAMAFVVGGALVVVGAAAACASSRSMPSHLDRAGIEDPHAARPAD